MPTSPRSKIRRIHNAFRQIRNILHRADVGIGPYGTLLRRSPQSLGPPDRGIVFQYFPTFGSRSCNWSLSAMRAMNSELVGFPFVLLTV